MLRSSRNINQRRYTTFKTLDSTLKGALRVFKLEGRFYQQRVLDVWEEAVGKTIAEVAQPIQVRFKTLSVRVAEPGWVHHLASFQDLFVENINRKVGKKVVEKIYFRMGEIQPIASQPQEGEEEARWQFPPLPSVTHEEIQGYLEPIKDIELRTVLERVLSRFKNT